MPHRDLLAALLPPVSYDANAPRQNLSLAMEGRELDRVQTDGAAVLGALRPWLWQQWLPDWERVYGLPGPLRSRRAAPTGTYCPVGSGFLGAWRHIPRVAQTLRIFGWLCRGDSGVPRIQGRALPRGRRFDQRRMGFCLSG